MVLNVAAIKHTKNELKAQREALRRYERFLPMLQLKKMQLQSEMQGIEAQLEEKRREAKSVRAAMRRWARLFAEPVEWETLLRVGAVSRGESNIAGVPIPVFESIRFDRAALDLYGTPPWWDDALDALEQLVRLEVETGILAEQHRRIGEELRTTAQRVNLFEKVKIPEARENIRVIGIFLGDQQSAAVVRAKFAKSRADALELEGVMHDTGEEGGEVATP